MIVLVDQKTETVKVYSDKGCESIPFDSIDELEDYGKQALYITKAVKTTTTEIVNLVRQLTTGTEAHVPEMFEGEVSQTYFLRSTAKGPVVVGDLSFRGPGQGVEIGEKLRKRILSSMVLQNLIKKKTLEIVDQPTMMRLARQISRADTKQKAKEESLKDQEMNKILADRPVDELLENPYEDDIETMEITDADLAEYERGLKQ